MLGYPVDPVTQFITANIKVVVRYDLLDKVFNIVAHLSTFSGKVAVFLMKHTAWFAFEFLDIFWHW